MEELKFFSQIAVRRSGELRAIVHRKPALVLALLAVNGRRSRSYLAEMLWPWSGEWRAAKSLNQAIYVIRAMTRADFVRSDKGSLWLDPAVRSDWGELQNWIDTGSLLEAVAVVSSGLFCDVLVDDLPDVSAWIDSVRARVQVSVLRLADTVLPRLLEDGCHQAVTDCCSFLSSWAETDRLDGYLDAARRIAGSGFGTHSAIPASADTEPLAELPFVGRADQLRELRRRARLALTGRPQVILLRGHPGAGKSRLANRFARAGVISGFRAVSTKAREIQRLSPYSTLLNVINSLERGGFPRLQADMLSALATLSGRGSNLPNHPPPMRLGIHDGQRQIQEAFLRLMFSVSGAKPLLLVLDDAQWLDYSSQAAIGRLIASLDHQPIVILLISRDPVPEFLLHLIDDYSLASVIDVPPLSESEVDSLVDKWNTQTGTSLSVESRFFLNGLGGSPFKISNFLNWGLAAGGSCLNTLGGRTAMNEEVLGMAAVMNGPVKMSEIGRLFHGAAVRKAVKALQSTGLLSVRSESFEISHDIFRQMVVSATDDSKRRLIHGRAAQILSHRKPPPLVEIARHMEAAGDRRFAFEYYTRAEAAAESVYAVREQCFCLEAASRLGPSPQSQARLEFKRARLLHDLGERNQATEAVSRLSQLGLSVLLGPVDRDLLDVLYAELADPPNEIQSQFGQQFLDIDRKASAYRSKEAHYRVLSQLAGALQFLGDGSLDYLVSRLTTTFSTGDDDWSVRGRRLLYDLVLHHVNRRQGLRMARALAESTGSAPPVQVVGNLGFFASALLHNGHLAESQQQYVRAIDLGESVGVASILSNLYNDYAVLLTENGRFHDAQSFFSKALSELSTRSRPFFSSVIRANAAICYFEDGQFTRAVEEATTVISSVPPASQSCRTAAAVLGLVSLEFRRNDTATEMESILGSLNSHNGFGGELSFVIGFQARFLKERGRRAEALRLLDTTLSSTKRRNLLWHCRLLLERAMMSSESENGWAIRTTNSVRRRASAMGASPLASRADRVLLSCEAQS